MALPIYLPQQANIKSYYNLNDVNDGSVNSHNLTNNNGVIFTGAKFGNGANFGENNTNKYLSITDNLDITGGNITMACWVKILTAANNNIICYQGCGSTQYVNYILYYLSTGELAVNRQQQGVANNERKVAFTMGSEFHHTALTYDGTNLKMYADGSQLGADLACSGNGNTAAVNMFMIGWDNAQYLAGTQEASIIADECVVWNIALSAEEIKQVYRGPNRGFFIFLSEAWKKHKKLWTPDKKLLLPEDLGFSY